MLALTVGLTSCYLPVRFDTEIEVTRFGTYSMIFDGYVSWVPLYDKVRKREIDSAEERKKAAVIVRDLKRDGATTEATYLRDGIFKLHWEKEGDLTATRLVMFMRRNENIISLKYTPNTREVTVEATTLSNINADRLAAIGLGMEGQIRVKTDARVVSHNANRVTTGLNRFYVWDVQGLKTPTPRMIISLR